MNVAWLDPFGMFPAYFATLKLSRHMHDFAVRADYVMLEVQYIVKRRNCQVYSTLY